MPSSKEKPELLYLCHRLPYPPNKGDKIRSFHLLDHLSKHFQVHLGTFVDDPADWKHSGKVINMCKSSNILPLHPIRARIKSLQGFLTNEALSIPYYKNLQMQDWVTQIWETRNIEYIFVFSSAMAQYVSGSKYSRARRVVDFVDVDSDKWKQYSASKPFYSAWLYQRESRKLENFDSEIARTVDASLFVSDPEASLFNNLPGTPGNAMFMTNGVDSDYFASDDTRENPFPSDVRPIVFTGAMDYWANIDAVSWFANQIIPLIHASLAEVKFYIVGSRPTDKVHSLSSALTEVTGSVADIRPYLQYAEVVVAPIRIARGIQNKVLEAMSMSKPVVVTAKGLEGIIAVPGRDVLVADTSADFAHATLKVLKDREFGAAIGAAGNRQISSHHSWHASLEKFQAVLVG